MPGATLTGCAEAGAEPAGAGAGVGAAAEAPPLESSGAPTGMPHWWPGWPCGGLTLPEVPAAGVACPEPAAGIVPVPETAPAGISPCGALRFGAPDSGAADSSVVADWDVLSLLQAAATRPSSKAKEKVRMFISAIFFVKKAAKGMRLSAIRYKNKAAVFLTKPNRTSHSLSETLFLTIVAYPRKKLPLPCDEYRSFVEQFLLIR